MREIKFRIYNEESKGFIGDSLGIMIDELNELKPHLKINQYTGLNDNKNKPIYEGDIVEFIYTNTVEDEKTRPKGIGYIFFDKKECCFLIKGRDYNFYLHEDLDVEVIGNIYENPDLLK